MDIFKTQIWKNNVPTCLLARGLCGFKVLTGGQLHTFLNNLECLKLDI